MEPDPDTSDLYVLEDPQFQRREWAMQRVGWAVLERSGTISVTPETGS